MNIDDYVNENVLTFPEYIPGEQIHDAGFIKINTNESPYPIPKTIIDQVKDSLIHSLNLYPEPTSESLCTVAAQSYSLNPDNVIVGNGSSDILSLVYRAFVEEGNIVAMPSPGFTLNRDLAAIQGGKLVEVRWEDNWSLPIEELLNLKPKLIVVANPNNPTGTTVPLSDIQTLAQKHESLIVLDEAYADFADENGLEILKMNQNLIILRSFSKSYSAAGMRLGMAFAHKNIIRYMKKVQNLYAVSRMTQTLGMAILKNKELFKPFIQLTVDQREITSTNLLQLGFECLPSSTNFIFAKVPKGTKGIDWYNSLKAEKILVRHFSELALENYLRITIGKPDDMAIFHDKIAHIRY